MNYKQKYYKYKKKYLELKHNQFGGNGEILGRMRSFGGDFVLVIGSSEHECWYSEFTSLPENVDKMVISLNRVGEGTNNFNLDFNEESTWRLFSEFNGRFSIIIFDYMVDKFINNDICFDIIAEIRNLLKNGGKLYKYFSYGNFFVPNNITTELIERNFEERDLNIIFGQFEEEIDSIRLDKIVKIRIYRIYKTAYGYYYSDINNIMNLITIEGVELKDNNVFINFPLSESIFIHIKSLYLFYNQMFYSNLLQTKYKFSTEVIEDCVYYPLKKSKSFKTIQKKM